MGLFSRRSGKPSKDQFAHLMLDAIRQAGEKAEVRYEPDEFRLVTEGEVAGTLNLDNAYREYCDASTGKKPNVVRRYVLAWFSRNKGVPDDFEDARPDLLPIIRSRSFFELLGLQLEPEDRPKLDWPYQVVGEHFGLGLAYDLPEAMHMTSQGHLDDWKVSFDDALRVAMANLAAISQEEFTSPVRGVWASPWHDNYDASRLMLLDVIRKHEVRGDYIAMVPNRDTLLLTGSEDEKGLARMADLAETALQSPRPLSGIALKLVGQEWQPFLPPAGHRQHQRYRLLWVQSVGQDYDEQKELLEKFFEQTEENMFVASFTAVQKEKKGPVQSYSVWSEVVDTLLPKTDLVFFFQAKPGQDEGEIVAEGEWDRVCQVVGHLMERTDYYPERFRVREFPGPDELKAIRMQE